MNATTKHLLQQLDDDLLCDCHNEKICLWDKPDPEKEEWHVIAFFEAMGNEDYDRASEHQERIKQVYNK